MVVYRSTCIHAIAVEVERIAEAQRFSAKLLAEASSSRTNNADENALNTRAEQGQLQAKEPRIGIVDTPTLKRRSREEI